MLDHNTSTALEKRTCSSLIRLNGNNRMSDGLPDGIHIWPWATCKFIGSQSLIHWLLYSFFLEFWRWLSFEPYGEILPSTYSYLILYSSTLTKTLVWHRYNQDDSNDETMEESGWKLVHGDVFRPPKYPKLFAAVIGSGIQIFCMAVITLCRFLIVFVRWSSHSGVLILFTFSRSFRHAWHAFASIQRSTYDRFNFLVRFYGFNSWLSFWPTLQNYERQRMEACRIPCKL